MIKVPEQSTGRHLVAGMADCDQIHITVFPTMVPRNNMIRRVSFGPAVLTRPPVALQDSILLPCAHALPLL